jgi:hypothetical protein
MCKKIVIPTITVLGLFALVQSASVGIAAQISDNAGGQAALSGKSAFIGHGGDGGRKKRLAREFDGEYGAGRHGSHRHRSSEHRSNRGGYGGGWRYEASNNGAHGYGGSYGSDPDYYGGGRGYGGYHGRSPDYYGPGSNYSRPEPYYGPGPYYGPHY